MSFKKFLNILIAKCLGHKNKEYLHTNKEYLHTNKEYLHPKEKNTFTQTWLHKDRKKETWSKLAMLRVKIKRSF